MTKTFRIWTKSGEPIDVQGNRIEFVKGKGFGMSVKLFNGKNVSKYTGVLALTEVMPPLIIERQQ